MNKDLQEGIDFSMQNQGIAYTYRNEEQGEDGKVTLGDEILLNPMNIKTYSKPMAVFFDKTAKLSNEERAKIIGKDNELLLTAIGDQPLVFSNMIKAEGALAVVELIYSSYANSLIIKEYDENATLKDLTSPITL